jgi:hypothetical protein
LWRGKGKWLCVSGQSVQDFDFDRPSSEHSFAKMNKLGALSFFLEGTRAKRENLA